MSLKNILIPVFSVLLVSTSFAAAPPLQVSTHSYSVYLKDKKVGDVTQTLRLQGDHYAFTSVTHTDVWFYHDTITEMSVGDVIASQFQFAHFKKWDGHGDQKVVLNADWTDTQVQMQDEKGTRSSDFTPPLYDHLNYQLQLAWDAMSHLKQFYYSVLTENGLEKLTFDRLGTEELMVEKKPVKTVKFCDQSDKNGLQLCLWYQGLTLVQSAQIKNGKMVEHAVLNT